MTAMEISDDSVNHGGRRGITQHDSQAQKWKSGTNLGKSVA